MAYQGSGPARCEGASEARHQGLARQRRVKVHEVDIRIEEPVPQVDDRSQALGQVDRLPVELCQTEDWGAHGYLYTLAFQGALESQDIRGNALGPVEDQRRVDELDLQAFCPAPFDRLRERRRVQAPRIPAAGMPSFR